MDNIIQNEEEIRFNPSSLTTSIGRIRTLSSLNYLEWFTIILSLGSIFFGIGFSIYRILELPSDSPHLIFSILVIINMIFGIYYLIHGIFQEEPFEIFTLAITIILIEILICVNYIQDSTIHMKLIRVLVSSVLNLPNIILLYILGKEYLYSGNLIFKTVGGDIKYQRLCRILFFAYSLLVFDLQSTLSSLILLLHRGLYQTTPGNYFFLIVGTIYVFISTVIGYISIRTENFRLVCFYGLSAILQPILVILLFTQIIDDGVEMGPKYSILNITVYVIGIALVTGHFSILATIVVVSHNFNQGLRQRVYGTIDSRGGGGEREPLNRDSVTNQNYDAITVAP